MTSYTFNLRSQEYFSKLFNKYPFSDVNQTAIVDSASLLINMWKRDSFLFLCGNGGSAADCEHIAGELLKSFRLSRTLSSKRREKLEAVQANINLNKGLELASKLQRGVRVISLPSQISVTSAILNDVGSEYIFAQQLEALAREKDVLFAISTSGNAENVLLAALVAKSKNMQVIALTGQDGGKLKDLADILINVPTPDTAEAQEFHLAVYHTVCSVMEEELFS
ncbi:MAG: D-sedoheptulose-7-phosphate isomerase [Lentisphaeria bacterium]